MALAKCRECGNRVSTEAAACPRCGCPRPSDRPAMVSSHSGEEREQRLAREQGPTAPAETVGTADDSTADVVSPSLDAAASARSRPGSVEAASAILVGALAFMAVGLYVSWFLIICAAGLLWGKLWWRRLTSWLALLVGLCTIGIIGGLPPRVENLAVLGSVLTFLGIAVLVSGEDPSPRTIRAGVLCAAVGIVSVFIGAALLRLGL